MRGSGRPENACPQQVNLTACNSDRATLEAVCASGTPVPSTGLGGVLKQKAPIWTFTAGKKSGLTGFNVCCLFANILL